MRKQRELMDFKDLKRWLDKMKIRISNKWNKQTNSYDKALYDIRETEGTISGRFTISIKKEEKWVSAHMAFTAFKSKIDLETKNSLLHHGGKQIEVSGTLSVDAANDGKGYFKFIINSARPAEKKEAVQSFHEAERETFEEIPF